MARDIEALAMLPAREYEEVARAAEREDEEEATAAEREAEVWELEAAALLEETSWWEAEV